MVWHQYVHSTDDELVNILYLESTIKDQDIFMIYFTRGKQSAEVNTCVTIRVKPFIHKC